ncbi:MAG: hypothetical protein ABL956_10090 [Hyphomonadaceae bacterium]
MGRAARSARYGRLTGDWKRASRRSRCRILIQHGSQDKANAPAGSEFFQKTASSKGKTLKVCDGRFPDLLADTVKEGVMADIQAWIDGQIPN